MMDALLKNKEAPNSQTGPTMDEPER